MIVVDPRRMMGGTVVHHQHKPRPDDYYSNNEQALRKAILNVLGQNVLSPAQVRLFRANLAIGREQRIIPVGPDA